MALTKTETIRTLAERAETAPKDVKAILESLAELAYREARDGFTLPGIGKLVLVHRDARMGRNPATGEAIKIAAKDVLRFRIAKQAKDAVLTTKSAKKR